MDYNIVEIFYSIQGEGKFTGTPAIFIRFFGCNLKCDFGNGFVCDDKAHSDKSKRTIYSLEELLRVVNEVPTKHVVITGGEPSLQDLNELITALQKDGNFVQVETNGTCFENIATADYITYSPKFAFEAKAPKMKFGFNELKLLAGVDNPVNTAEWASVKNKYVQPIGNEHEWDIDNVNYCIELVKNNPAWKLSLQTHKAIGVR